MGDALKGLLEAGFNAASLSTYRRSWEILHQFKSERLPATSSIFPLSSDILVVEKNLARFSCTVMTYVSALSFLHRLAGWPDSTRFEMVKLTLRGYLTIIP